MGPPARTHHDPNLRHREIHQFAISCVRQSIPGHDHCLYLAEGLLFEEEELLQSASPVLLRHHLLCQLHVDMVSVRKPPLHQFPRSSHCQKHENHPGDDRG